MGVMKELYITIHNGGDEAVAAVQRVADDWRARLEQAADEIERLNREVSALVAECQRMKDRLVNG